MVRRACGGQAWYHDVAHSMVFPLLSPKPRPSFRCGGSNLRSPRGSDPESATRTWTSHTRPIICVRSRSANQICPPTTRWWRLLRRPKVTIIFFPTVSYDYRAILFLACGACRGAGRCDCARRHQTLDRGMLGGLRDAGGEAPLCI